MMREQPPAVTGLVCTGDSALARAAVGLLEASGFQVLALVERGADAIATLSAVATSGQGTPNVIVLDLAVCGIAGVGVVPNLMQACPWCAVVVVSPFPALAPAILEVGAALVVEPSDLRPVLGLLAEIRSAAHAGYPCPCCAPPSPGGTAATSGAASSKVSKPEALPGLLWDRPYGSGGRGGGKGPDSSASPSTDADDS